MALEMTQVGFSQIRLLSQNSVKTTTVAPVHSGLFWSKNGHFWGLGKVAKNDFWGPYRVALIFGVL